MRARRCRSWLGLAALGLGVVATMPARAAGPPGDTPAAKADDPAEAQRLEEEVERLYGQGKVSEALPLAERALSLREQALGQGHPKVADALNRLALLCRAKGDFARAEPLYQRALRILETALGPDAPDVAAPLSNLAEVYLEKGDYAHAEPLYLRALRIREKALGPEHPDVAASLNNLAEVYRERGDYARAEPLYLRALRIKEKALGPDHLSVATSLNNLAEVYRREGAFARAEPLYQRALRIKESALGPDHPSVATSLNNLATLYQQKGDDALAEPLYQRALRIKERTLGPDHRSVAIALNNLAFLYKDRGDLARAELYYQRALRIKEKALGPDHPSVASSLDNLAVLHVMQGRLSDAVRARQRGAAIEDRNATLNLAHGSETQKRAYMAALRDATDSTISLHVEAAPSNAQAARLALTTILQRKGRVLDAMADSIAALRRRLTPSDQALFDQLSSVKSRLGAALFRGSGELPPDEYKKNLQDLEGERQRLEEQLGQRSAAFRAEQRPLTLEQVQEAIPDGAALLEILRYKPFNPKADRASRWGAPRYVAYVLRRHGDPSFVDLGTASVIDAVVIKARRALADINRTHDPRPAARALDALVMQPIRALLGDARWVLLSPDGDLNLIPFEALVDEQNRYLIERFAFTYLTSGRDLVRLEEHAPPKESAVIIGHPAFGAGDASAAARGPDEGQRGLRSVDLRRVSFPPLPGTAEEARTVAHGLSDARVLLLAQATEGAVKAVKAPRILHIATHGFFLPDAPEPKLPDERRSELGREAAPEDVAALVQRENPLLRAGLALAGANMRISGDSDDGILTALEVSDLDLYGTKLVVLSACETGIGEAVSGEGVYGMRRALVMAGAETQMMSLWQVDSGYTRDLMVAYYERLKAGAGRGEALRRAQLEMMAREETSRPSAWASFIVSGDWRTLDGAPVTPNLSVHPGPRGCACAEAGDGGAERWAALGLAAAIFSALCARRRIASPPRS